MKPSSRSRQHSQRKAERLHHGLAPFWMLNDASTVAEKLDYMRRCHAGGITALALHPRAGNLTPFASREWFEMIKAIVAEAERLGMHIWLYDEDPFPSGAAGGLVMAHRSDLRARAFDFKMAPESLKAGELWFIAEQHVLWAGLAPTRPGLPAIDLTADVGPIRNDWFSTERNSIPYYAETPVFDCVRGSTKHMRFAIRVPAIQKGYRLAAVIEDLTGQGSPWGSLPDLLNPATFPVYARYGLDPYEYAVGHHFGKLIPGIFTDEAKPFGGMPITGDFFESFKKMFGYDLRPRLHQLFGDPLDDEYMRVRLDYRRWVLGRFLDAFVHPYRKWCDARGLHLVGHFSPEDDPIDETFCLSAVMPIMKAMGLPGCDVIIPAVGDAASPTLNLGSLRVGSLKSQTSRRYATSESQALGEWVITSAKTRHIYAWQKTLGVDRFFTHGFFTSNDGIANYEAPPDYGPNSPIFRGTGAVNAWLMETDALMDGGKERAEVALLDNVFAYWTWARRADLTKMKAWRRNWWRALLHLLQAHVGTHALDTNDTLRATIKGNTMVVGAWRYTTIVIPHAGLIEESVFKMLQRAAASGVKLIWLGGGPTRLANAKNTFKTLPPLPGTVLRPAVPSISWCRANLPRQIELGGPGAADCFVRRYHAEDGLERLFICNLAEKPRTVTLPDEGGLRWNPDRDLVDGALSANSKALRWEVPAMGNGSFHLAISTALPRHKNERPAATGAVTFKRLGNNILRLDACRVTLKDRPPVEAPYPQPFWQNFDDYHATRSADTFAGHLPIESTVAESDLRYLFTINAECHIQKVTIALDPRSIRGSFDVYLNGKKRHGNLTFPLPHITPLRLPITLRRGENRLELRFNIINAMEGILANLRLEGEFGVVVQKGQTIVTATTRHSAVATSGWLDMGLAHYMGDGRYTWSESFSAAELKEKTWWLELDDVIDSATLRINGVIQGTRAWRPWRWRLQGLTAGRNQFELTVSSTAGNTISRRYPAQPQGWLGGASLLTT